MVVKQLEMPVFIGGDQAAYLFQYGFFSRVTQSVVITAGTGFHHAARDQFPGSAATNGSFRIQLNLITRPIARKSRREIPTRISQHTPAAKSIAMLGFFHAPMFGGRAESRVISENARQVGYVIRRITLHHGGGLDQRHDFGINLGRVKPIPANLINVPMFHKPAPTA